MICHTRCNTKITITNDSTYGILAVLCSMVSLYVMKSKVQSKLLQYGCTDISAYSYTYEATRKTKI